MILHQTRKVALVSGFPTATQARSEVQENVGLGENIATASFLFASLGGKRRSLVKLCFLLIFYSHFK